MVDSKENDKFDLRVKGLLTHPTKTRQRITNSLF